MAIPAGDDNGVLSYIYGGNTNLTYEQLQRRRAVATALASRQRGFPKNTGEGLTYLGEALGDRMQEARLEAAERDYASRVGGALNGAGLPGGPPGAAGPQMIAPPGASPGGATPGAAGGAPPGGGAAPGAPTGPAFRPAPSYMGQLIDELEPDPTMRSYYGHMASKEAPAGPGSVSPTGAAGPYQFTRDVGGQYGLYVGGTDRRADPRASLIAMQNLTRDNIAQFTKITGRPPTVPELALMHQQGGKTGANMIAGTGNAPPNNLRVNNIDPRLPPQEAAKAIMNFYGLPDQQLPESYGGPKAAPPVNDPRARITGALMGAPQEVAQENPTLEGPQAPGMPQADVRPGGNRLALSVIQDSMSDAPPIVPRFPEARGAGILPDDQDETPTDIQPAPRMAFSTAPQAAPQAAPVPQVAPQAPPQVPPQAPPPQVAPSAGPGSVPVGPGVSAGAPPPAPPGPPGAPGRGIPGPLSPVVPGAPNPNVGRTPVQQIDPAIKPPPPPLPDVTDYERRGYMLMRQFPGDPNVGAYAKQLIEYGAAQRKAEYERGVEVYKGDLARWEQEQQQRTSFERSRPTTELALRKGEYELGQQQEAQQLTQRLGGIKPEIFEKGIEKSAEGVKNLPAATMAIEQARQLLNTNKTMFTGSTAEVQLSMAKLREAMGMPADPRIAPTEAFRAYIAPLVAQLRMSMAGSANISDADMRAAVAAAGGDIKLDRNSIIAVLNGVEKINTLNAIEHQKKLLTYAGDDPNRQRVMFGAYGLPMETVVPPAAVQRLHANSNNPQALADFDAAFFTPGLARRVLMMRRP